MTMIDYCGTPVFNFNGVHTLRSAFIEYQCLHLMNWIFQRGSCQLWCHRLYWNSIIREVSSYYHREHLLYHQTRLIKIWYNYALAGKPDGITTFSIIFPTNFENHGENTYWPQIGHMLHSMFLVKIWYSFRVIYSKEMFCNIWTIWWLTSNRNILWNGYCVS